MKVGLGTCKIGLGRSQQKYSTERTVFVHLEPKTAPTKRLQGKDTGIEVKMEGNKIEIEGGKSSRIREYIQEVVVSAESEEVVNALNESALKDGPLTTEEGDNNQQSHESMA